MIYKTARRSRAAGRPRTSRSSARRRLNRPRSRARRSNESGPRTTPTTPTTTGVPARTELRAQGPTLSPPYDVSICVRTSSSRPHSRVGVCSDIPRTMGKAAGAWLCESYKREGCVPETPGPSGGLAWTVRPALGTDEPENFAWTFRNAPEGPDKQIDILAREHLLRSEKLLVVYGELFSQPGNAVITSGAAPFAAWAAHSLLWLPAVCESRLLRPSL